MKNLLDQFYQTSLYHNEEILIKGYGFKKLSNERVIFWINDTIFFLSDYLEKTELIKFKSDIELINFLDDYTFYIKTDEVNSFLILFNKDYTINKRMNLLNTDLLLILDIDTFIFLEKTKFKNKLVIMKRDYVKNRQYVDIVDDNVLDYADDIYKICKISSKKFLFYRDKDEDEEFNIYSIEFSNRKFLINNTFNKIKKAFDYMSIISILPFNEKYILKFIYSNGLIIQLINIKTFQIVYNYFTNLEIKECFINNNIEEIPYFQLMKFLNPEVYNKYNEMITDLDSKQKKGAKKIILRKKNNIEKLYIFYINFNFKLSFEKVKIIYLKQNLGNAEIKIINDDYECEYEGWGQKITFNENVIYEEKNNSLFVNENNNYFILVVSHIDGWLHCCFQIIAFSK